MVKIIYFELIFHYVLFFYVKYQFGLEIHSCVISKIRRLHKSVSSGGDHVVAVCDQLSAGEPMGAR